MKARRTKHTKLALMRLVAHANGIVRKRGLRFSCRNPLTDELEPIPGRRGDHATMLTELAFRLIRDHNYSAPEIRRIIRWFPDYLPTDQTLSQIASRDE